MSSSDDSVPDHFDHDTDNDASDLERDNQDVQKRKRGANKNYLYRESFDNIELAKQYIKQQGEQKWVHQYDRTSEIGLKRFYKCQYAKQCGAFGYILLHSEEETKVSWFSTQIHDHKAVPQERGIPSEIKEKIEELLRKRITTPSAILTSLEEIGIRNIGKQKIVNFLAQYRKKKYGEASISLTELKRWCKEREETPDDRDTPFVGAFCYKLDSDEISYFRLFITTIRLLQNALKSQLVAADGTYKIIYQGNRLKKVYIFLNVLN